MHQVIPATTYLFELTRESLIWQMSSKLSNYGTKGSSPKFLGINACKNSQLCCQLQLE